MYGKLFFSELSDLAEFLREFELTNSTAVFEVTECPSTHRWVLEFSGGK